MALQYPSKFEKGMPFIHFTSWKYNLPLPSITYLEKHDRSPGTFDEMALYMPGDFTESAQASWSPEAAFQASPTVAGAVLTNVTEAIKNKGAGKLVSSLQAGFGTAPFPTDINIFKEVSPLGFTLNFTLIPFDSKEAEDISKICYAFKRSMIPTMGDLGATNVVLTFPDIWDVQFEGIKGIAYNKESIFQNMAITNCSITYVSGQEGASVYKDQYPTHIKLSVQFQGIQKFYLGK